jgi:uncharacterized protein (TIGR02145 family)
VKNHNPRWIVSSRAFFAMTTTLIAGMALLFTNPPAQAETQSSDLSLTLHTLISLSISSPCETELGSPDLKLEINPTATGVVSTCPSVVRVDSNTPGYSLSFKASSANLDHTSIPGNIVVPTTNGATPAQLSLNSWGFALPDLNLTGYGAFDTTYTQRNNTPYTTTTDKYAATPTTDKEVKHLLTGNYNDNTVVADDETTFYYGAAIDLNTLAGEYKTTITYTVTGETIPCQWEPGISFEDENCVEPEVACVSGTQFKGNVGTMQNINTSTWNQGDTGIAKDIRNDQEYCIGKLKDDKVWMLDNLKLELGFKDDANPTKDTRILEPANTNIENDTPIYFTQDGTGTGQAMTGMTGNFTTSGYNTRSGASGTTSSNYDAWRQNDPGSEDTTLSSNSRNCDPQGFRINCGYLYNFYTATAGSAAQADYSNGDTGYIAQQSICPAGWKLPSGQNASGDFGVLDNSYKPGGTGSSHSLANPDTQGLWLSAGAWRGAFSGSYLSGLASQGSNGYYWSSSVNTLSSAYATYFWNIHIYPGTYSYGRYDGFAVRCLVN